jgi:hypothetical protein
MTTAKDATGGEASRVVTFVDMSAFARGNNPGYVNYSYVRISPGDDYHPSIEHPFAFVARNELLTIGTERSQAPIGRQASARIGEDQIGESQIRPQLRWAKPIDAVTDGRIDCVRATTSSEAAKPIAGVLAAPTDPPTYTATL